MKTSFSLLIVVPTLDSFEYLPRLTSSLQGQSFEDWRLLFVDGPSGSEHRHWLKEFCYSESRATWIEQITSHPGIFGAMNQGFAAARPHEWVLFWGSDDWAASPHVFATVFSSLDLSLSSGAVPDLIVCRGRYVDQTRTSLTRATAFRPAGSFSRIAYRNALFLGSTPPHQATFFGPGSINYLDRYADDFRLSADLDYFLRLSRNPRLNVQCLNVELVHMLSGGISGVQTQRRLAEVRRAYRRIFGMTWWFPFLMRYARRVISLLQSWN